MKRFIAHVVCSAALLGCSSQSALPLADASTDRQTLVDVTPPSDTVSDIAVDSAPPSDVPTTEDYFPVGAPWTQDITTATVDAQSATVISALSTAGGWGLGHMQIDFSIDVLQADATAPLMSFTPTSSFYSPDCDNVPMPIPVGGNLEGETGYSCTMGGDCHLIVSYAPTHKLYEMWHADITGGVFSGGCLAVWDLTRVYPPSGRGDGCTSADAAGFPIAPLLFNADEVTAGTIAHAIRFVLPNDRIEHGAYVHPATHDTDPASGGASAVPYGAHLRLRPDFPMASLPNDAARIVARAMQHYGIFLADGGNVALTAQADTHTTAKWATLMDSHALEAIQVTDFVMLDGGASIPYTGSCVRNP